MMCGWAGFALDAGARLCWPLLRAKGRSQHLGLRGAHVRLPLLLGCSSSLEGG
jgi:hypothetical protein